MAHLDHRAPLLLDIVGDDGLKDLPRDVVREASHEVIEEELTAAIGAGKHERTPSRIGQRSGS